MDQSLACFRKHQLYWADRAVARHCENKAASGMIEDGRLQSRMQVPDCSEDADLGPLDVALVTGRPGADLTTFLTCNRGLHAALVC